jgi:ribosomal protein S18 acetylase RimI-like enzyme
MSTELRPMREDEFPAWRDASETSYADQIHEKGGLSREAADTKAQKDFAALLPRGVETPDHSLHVIQADGAVVGSLWTAVRETDSGRVLFVYEIRLSEDVRGRGIGRAAMTLAEEVAREQGLARIELNVFGGNEVARSLYRSLDYDEVAVYMGKSL